MNTNPQETIDRVHLESELPDKVRKATRRIRVSLPGLVDWAANQRAEEHLYETISEYVVELTCFDTRAHRDHVVTRPLIQDSEEVSDTILRAAIRHHVPGGPRRGLLVTTILGEVPHPALGLIPPDGDLTAARYWIVFPADLWECAVNLRWCELGYESFSQYVAALVLCDLLLSGRHLYYNGGDKDAVLLASMDAETIATYRKNKPARLYLDHIIQEKAGRKMTRDEIEARMAEVAREIRAYALSGKWKSRLDERAARSGIG